MSTCVFCKIINRDLPSKIIRENDDVIVIEDRSPKAPIHYLIIPKVHIVNINHMQDTEEHYKIVREMFKMVRKITFDLPGDKSFNFIANNGESAGQSVPHMHWHILSGKNAYSSAIRKFKL